MDFLLIFLVPILLIAAIAISALPLNKGRRAKVFFITTGVPLAIFFGDEIIGQAYLHAKCSIDGGYRFKEKIKTEGYFDVDYDKGCGLACLEALAVWGYSYYETEVRYKYPYHANDNGIYKYNLAEKNSDLCVGGREIPREKGILPEAKCVAYKKMEKPSSTYELSMIRGTDILRKPFRMTRVFSYVRNRKTDEIIASATSYKHWGGWVRNNSFSDNGASVCPSYRESHGAIENNIITSQAGRVVPNNAAQIDAAKPRAWP